MSLNRVIPVLTYDHSGLVKTFKYGKRSYVGDVINAVKIFNEKEVDELVILDIDASKKRSAPNYKLIEEIASECFIPLAYGGGVKDVETAGRIFNLGVEKIIINSSAIEDTGLIRRLSSCFGSQSIVVSVDIKKSFFKRRYQIYNAARGVSVKGDVNLFLKEIQKLGAGEIILSSVDLDGTLAGPDISLTKSYASVIKVPLVAVGGVESVDSMRSLLDAGADAVGAGAFFVFHGRHRAVLISYPDRGLIDSLS